MRATAILQPRDVLALLDELGDDDLCAVIAHAQARLLDRPIPPGTTSVLAVEVVRADEGRLLALYRSLPMLAKKDLLAQAWQCAHAPRPITLHRGSFQSASSSSHCGTADHSAMAAVTQTDETADERQGSSVPAAVRRR